MALFNIPKYQISIFSHKHILDKYPRCQVASGAFAQLRDKLVPTMQKVPTPDLSPEVLASLTTLMQAQAQECIYIKAVADKMKEKVGRKLDFPFLPF